MVAFGTYHAGDINQLGPSRITTKFFHIAWIPLIPMGSFAVFDEADGKLNGANIPLSGKSAGLGYLRGFLGCGMLISVYLAIGDDRHPEDKIAWWNAVIAFLGAIFALVMSYRFGRLHGHDLKVHTVYQRATGVGVDPAMMGDSRVVVRDNLMARVAEIVRGLNVPGYSSGPDPMKQWPAIATNPSVSNAELAAAALALARIEWSAAKDADKEQWAAIHLSLWEKIQRLHPNLLPAVEQSSGGTVSAALLVLGVATYVGAIALGLNAHRAEHPQRPATVRAAIESPSFDQRRAVANGLLVAHYPSDFAAQVNQGGDGVQLQRGGSTMSAGTVHLRAIENPVSTDDAELSRVILGAIARAISPATPAPEIAPATCHGLPGRQATLAYREDDGVQWTMKVCIWVRQGIAYAEYLQFPAVSQSTTLPLLQRIADATEYPLPPSTTPAPSSVASPSGEGEQDPTSRRRHRRHRRHRDEGN